MKVRLAIAVAVLQIGVLAFMAGQREWISRFGDPITLRTAPIDPNDPMRGAYVRLNYEINWVPASLCKDGPAEWIKTTDYREQQRLRDRLVYASLDIDRLGFARIIALSDRKPGPGRMLRGRVVSVSSSGIQARYGIEALFMQQDAARRVEHDARETRAGAPMNVRVAVSSSGIAVTKGYEWEPLGLTLLFDRDTRSQPFAAGERLPGIEAVTVIFHNYGEKPLALALPDGGHAFRLVPNDRWGAVHYAWSGEGRRFKLPAMKPSDIVVLEPGKTHEVRVDLTDPRWWVIDTNTPGSEPLALRDVTDPFSAGFRIEYAPPEPEMLAGLPNAELVRQTSLCSRAFTANRGID